jgi:hypothetical protein
MAGNEPRKPVGLVLFGVAALAAAVYASTRTEDESATGVPAAVAGWHGAMEFYRRLALWAGTRAMAAENKYWEAVR